MEKRCPECGSDDVIEWDDGYICRDCGCAFDGPDKHRKKCDECLIKEWQQE